MKRKSKAKQNATMKKKYGLRIVVNYIHRAYKHEI